MKKKNIEEQPNEEAGGGVSAIAEMPETSEDFDSVRNGQGNDTRQFVLFMVADEVFAVDLAPVQEIIRLPDVVRVPLAPAALNGLANLRGKVLPIISLRRMFGFEEIAYNEATRAVVVDVGQSLGFVVDRVASVMSVESNRIESVDTISSTVDTDLLSGLVKDMGDHKMVMILDFAKLVERQFSHIASTVKATIGAAGAVQTDISSGVDENTSDERQLVSFVVAGQEYAVSISDVQEIVHIPEIIIHVPHAQDHVLGIMTLRSKLLPLMNLRKMFALPDQKIDEKSRIIVLTLGTSSVGVVVDGVSEVLRVSEADIGPMPSILAREDDLAEISGICRLNEGKRLVSIIATQNLFDHESTKEALTTVDNMTSQTEQTEAEEQSDVDDVEQDVVFRLDKEEFGVPIETVQEIVRIPDELTRVPHSQAFVEGVINLRGTVLPVVDLRTRLGMQRAERSDRQRIMVFLLTGMRTGFIVDQVSEVLRIAKNMIEPSPKLSGEQGTLLSRMANLEKQKRMIQLIDPTHLLDNDTATELHRAVKSVKK